jgi:Molecular chaperone
MNFSKKKQHLPGIWIGIDLGTTNSTAAFYSPAKSKAKLIRFRDHLAKRNHKYGRILPSVVSYRDGKVEKIGISSLESKIQAQENTEKDQKDAVILSSVKRIWGMDAKQVQNELKTDPTFLQNCPFDVVLHDDNVGLKIGREKDEIISPIQVAEILLRTIRLEADAYFQREQESAVGMISQDTANNEVESVKVRHCIMTVPAHFSRNRRDQMVHAAKQAGFDGYVGTIVESTAAALSYGLFTKPLKSNDERGRIIMVFDMGGGTTDVTIAQMVPSENQEDPIFKILGTAGERRLGGDDMDLKLAEFVKHKSDSKSESRKGINYELRMACRTAKEALCGDGKDQLPVSKTRVRLGNDSVVISQEDFNKAIASIVNKASELVEIALEKCQCAAASVDEVILVGGATRTPSIRSMLQSKFRNELCHSIDPYAAVAQGAAIQCAIQSELVPKHELRNALMLDALPHPIGVLIENEFGELYVPILERGMELPAMNYATFRLDHVRQKGVTVIAVEDVDDDLPLERIGEFTFLLHRLSEEQYQTLEKGGRTIDVGMTVDKDGKFIVSIFDKNDPEHLVKKAKYQQWKRGDENNQLENQVYSLGEKYRESRSLTREDFRLLIFCISLFVLYVSVKIGFQSGAQSYL